jgi:hypothetical protein
MSYRVSACRAAWLAVTVVWWAAACGSGNTTVATSLTTQCKIYPGGGVIPEAPDGPSLCPAGACNFQTQAGCASSEVCSPHYDMASNSIIPACLRTGTVKSGAACDDSMNVLCAPGLVCVDGKCAKPCCGGDWTACDEGESCIRSATIFETTSGEKIPYDKGLGTCAPVGTCNVLDTTSCSSDSVRPVCRIVDPRGFVACQPHSTGGDAQLGEDCSEQKQCAAGLHCAGLFAEDASAQTKCVRLCAWGSCDDAKPACGKDEGTCVHFLHDPEGVGECTADWRGEGIPVGSASDAGTRD